MDRILISQMLQSSRLPVSIFFLSFLLCFILVSCTREDKLTDSIRISAEYIDNHSYPDGKFVYEVDPVTNEINQFDYNILRHSGTIYALSSYYKKYNDKKALEVLIKSSDFLKSCCLGPIYDRDDVLAVWSLPEINRSLPYKKAKLGGSGLALAALVSLEQIKPGFTDIEDLRKIAEFILYMQKEDGSFYSIYYPPPGGRDDSWTSLYYPGEAALGLAMLYEIDPQRKWFDSAVKVLTYLAKSREGKRKIPHDHWSLIATRYVLRTSEEKSIEIPRELIISHGMQVTKEIIKGVPKYPESSPLRGTLVRGGRSAPNATRLEGILAFYDFIPDDEKELKNKVRNVSIDGIDYLLRLQIKEGEYKGGMPGGYYTESNRIKDQKQRFIRIDYVQHALSAFIDYQLLFKKLDQN